MVIAGPLDGTTATEYEMIWSPPALGVLQASDTEPFPAEEEVMLGAAGRTAIGVKVTGLEADPAPKLLTAVTVIEYVVPLVRPLSVAEFVESS